MMERIPQSPPLIEPVGKSIGNVVWSVMIPVYNCSLYLKEAIESLLLQDLGAELMQIEVVDDCSTDIDVEALVNAVGRGRINYFGQKQNVGSLRNFETCINRSTGKYIHLLHGDDRLKPGFYRHIEQLFNQYPEAGSAFCAWDYIDKHGTATGSSQKEREQPGLIENCFEKLASGQIQQQVATVVKREVYEALGSFYAVVYGEDWVMNARIARQYPVAYTPLALAEYRRHANSISENSANAAQNIKDISIVSKIISSYFPSEQQQKVKKRIGLNYNYWYISNLYQLWFEIYDSELVISKLKLSLKGELSFSLLLYIFKLRCLIITRSIQKIM
jgi:glycosyltransferase involved in cell wall biosynthesis